jgi:hypothetical protein
MTQTTCDDPVARPQLERCHDCGSEELIEIYVLLDNGEPAPICYECYWRRGRAARVLLPGLE